MKGARLTELSLALPKANAKVLCMELFWGLDLPAIDLNLCTQQPSSSIREILLELLHTTR